MAGGDGAAGLGAVDGEAGSGGKPGAVDAAMGSGGTADAGGPATGGATGNSCYDSSGHVVVSAKTCTSASDCRIETVLTCCGSDWAIGLVRTASCSLQIPDCGNLGCAKNMYPQAEDGNTTEGGGAIAVTCDKNLCTTYVTKPAGGGGAGGGGSGGTTSSGGRDGSAGDASTGACEDDNDCVFRPLAGCCGMCLAVDDPVPPTILCGAMCFGSSNCACVDHRCAEGTLPLNSPCAPEHDLCQTRTKCCNACGPQPLDGSSGCADPVCTSAVVGSDGVALCPETM